MTTPKAHEAEAGQYYDDWAKRPGGSERNKIVAAYLAGLHSPRVERLVEALRKIIRVDGNEALYPQGPSIARQALEDWRKGGGG
jgi:hypothetical protein